MAKLKTEKMPSGAQQWVRGKKTSDKMQTLLNVGTRWAGTKALVDSTRGMIDLSEKSRRDSAAKKRKPGTAGANVKKKK